MAKLAKALEKALKQRGMPFSSEQMDGGVTAIDFEIPETPDSRSMGAFIEGDRVMFVIAPDLEIPRSRSATLGEWVHRANLLAAPTTFLFDPDELWLGARHTVLCSGIPAASLDGVLKTAWESLAASWRDHTPALLEVLTGRDPADTAGEEEDDDQAIEAWEDAVNDLHRSLTSAVADYFDEELASGLDGSIYAVAEEYLARLLDTERESLDVEVEAGMSGDVGFVTLRSTAAGALRFRFDPAAVRTRMEGDARGLTLYYSAEPAAAKRVLQAGFVDEEVAARDYSMDHDGIPVTEDEERTWMAVPLSSEPGPLDDHGARTALLRIDWHGEAFDLEEFEQAHTAFSETDAWVMDGPRRWNVPAALLNEALKDGRASVSGGDGR